MSLKIYNTQSGQKEEFIPRKPGEVGVYVCGVTPYNFCHIGNARPYVIFDVIRRFLESQDWKVLLVQNFTDIDDKIINQAQNDGVEWNEIPARYIPAYFEDMDALGVKRADIYPLATEHISEIISLVEELVKNGLGYEIDGDVYFRVKKFNDYGKLSNRTPEELLAGARIEVDERKEDPLDFALWKAAKEGEPSWPSPWGPGRPGWHIECSAMSLKYLGMGFDIHGGGADLVFPHHENEIAQAEGAKGTSPFVRYWVHNGWVTMASQKMSKSLGNIRSIRDVLSHWPADVVRLFLLSVHYRSPLDFTEEAMESARAGLERLQVGMKRLKRLTANPAAEGPLSSSLTALEKAEETASQRFQEAMEDDFNTAAALGAIFDLVRELHRATGQIDYKPTSADQALLTKTEDTLKRLTGILGLMEKTETVGEDLTGSLVDLLVEVRNQAREARNFEMSDTIRARLTDLGIILEDGPQGTTWRRR
ncbi:MAG: cysteine--tRNA ligase [Armatimonadetes bacterium]|nr:cysteine--tRNA ligase [Armatimonadota bacterium]NIO75132.1 cysteine--tRNA ligase [Armatimonadota bacterium]NIO95756.1 cysteine--tRNA ligase [Armatimonadota bacterium]